MSYRRALRRTVIDVYASWCGPCIPLRLFATEFHTVKFIAANAGAVVVPDVHGTPLPETSEPTFALHLVRSGSLLAALHKPLALRPCGRTTSHCVPSRLCFLAGCGQNNTIYEVVHGIGAEKLRESLQRYVAMRAASEVVGMNLMAYMPPKAEAATADKSRRNSGVRRMSVLVRDGTPLLGTGWEGGIAQRGLGLSGARSSSVMCS